MMNRRTRSTPILGLALVLILLAACGTTEPPPAVIQATSTSRPATTTPTQVPAPTEGPLAEPSPGIAVLSKATRYSLFTQTWMFVNDLYVYPDYGGLDWEAVKEEYSEKIANAASDEEFYDLMREMVDLLGDEHSVFLSPDFVDMQNAIYDRLRIPGGIGAGLSEVEGDLVFVQVFPDNPAFEAGLRPGERIIKIDGVPRQQFATVEEAILAIIGEAGTEVVLTVQSVEGVQRQVLVRRAEVDLEKALVRGRLIEGTRLGLLILNGFDSPEVSEAVRKTLGELISSDTLEGLIVDVRANRGGDVDTLLGTLALFVDGGSIGRQAGRKTAYDLLIPEGATMPELEGLPVVVLTGPRTSSAGESFAVGMQLHERATILGMPSAGNTEYVFLHQLSDRSVLYLAEWVYELPDGALIEGRGVQPDVLVPMDWWLYGADDDPQIRAAIELLGSE
jgi:carboxyl-terminal processing protease